MFAGTPLLFPNSAPTATDADHRERMLIEELYAAYDRIERDQAIVAKLLTDLHARNALSEDTCAKDVQAA